VSDADFAALAAVADVSRETRDKLTAYVALIRRWNKAENLIAPDDLGALWTRHIADCAQLPGLAPDALRWLDFGSGAGLPGIVIALVGRTGTSVDLIESNRRRCAFLRQAIRETGAPARVHEGRAEALLPEWKPPIDRVTARAVAPLQRLLEIARPLLAQGAVGLFPKGRDYRREIDEARALFAFDLVEHTSRIEKGGTILEIRNCRPRSDR
jgi:16S rRNA (guanine527-N7)-methyltransferase